MASRRSNKMESSSIDGCVVAFVVVLVLRLRKRRRFWDESMEFLCFSFGISLVSLLFSSRFFFCHCSSFFIVNTDVSSSSSFLFLLPLDHMTKSTSYIKCCFVHSISREDSLGQSEEEEEEERLICFVVQVNDLEENTNGQFDPISNDRRQTEASTFSDLNL